MNPIFILACGYQRVKRPMVAARLFEGLLFRSALLYARGRVDDEQIVMLTGFEGLLRLGTPIDPAPLRFLSALAFADRVLDQLQGDFSDLVEHDSTDIVFLGFDVFHNTLSSAWSEVTGEEPTFQTPLLKIPDAQQIDWLLKQTEEVTC